MSTKILITGAGGQLAQDLIASAPKSAAITAVSRAQLDIGDRASVDEITDRLAPAVILNAAAYTAVDRAESEAEQAYRVNRDGPAHLAAAARRLGARLVHVSTDFVFDGGAGRAYRPEDPTDPIGVYGASKRAGEVAVREIDETALIVRTSWVYSPHGANFMKTMLRLMASRPEVRVVADQIGAPTSAATLAQALWDLVDLDARGLFHFADAGVASWYDFAVAIAEDALTAGLLPAPVRVTPITTADYPTPARRPAFSLLDRTATWALLGGPRAHWRVALREVLARLEPAS